MKNFLIFILVVVGAGFWFKGWVQSGRMDNFILRRQNPRTTPKILNFISGVCYLSQNTQAASHYYRWMIQDYPDHPDMPRIRWNLSQCYEDLKRKDLALEQYVVLKDSFTQTAEGQRALSAYNRTRF